MGFLGTGKVDEIQLRRLGDLVDGIDLGDGNEEDGVPTRTFIIRLGIGHHAIARTALHGGDDLAARQHRQHLGVRHDHAATGLVEYFQVPERSCMRAHSVEV